MKKIPFLALIAIIALTSCKTGKHANLGDGIFADITTNKGEIILRLEHEKTPVTVANFVSLAEGKNPFVSDQYKGKKYYDSLTFHRVMKDFMIQGGDPLGTGSGNPGYKFKDEFSDSLKHTGKGILSMANSGTNTNGSQFFITHKATPWLDNKHSVFGEVVSGIEVVDSIANVEVAAGNRPTEPVIMTTVEIIRNGKEARRFDAVQIMKDYFSEEEANNAAMIALKAEFAKEAEAQKEMATETASGLKILILEKGTGEKPKMGVKVPVFYAGYLPNGNLFDSNIEAVARKYKVYDHVRFDRGFYKPFPMMYSLDAQLITGFKEGLLSMNYGDKIRVFIPSHLGYGSSGNRNVIPPNADLVFDLEIVANEE